MSTPIAAIWRVAGPDASPLIFRARRGIMDWPGVRNSQWLLRHSRERFGMNDFNRKVEEATARLNKRVAEFAATMEQETAELVKYLNEEIVPEARQHSTKALRIASDKLSQLADYMDSHKPQASKLGLWHRPCVCDSACRVQP